MTEPQDQRPTSESDETKPVSFPGGDSPDPDFEDDATIPDTGD
jgi:hypothetical protein